MAEKWSEVEDNVGKELAILKGTTSSTLCKSIKIEGAPCRDKGDHSDTRDLQDQRASLWKLLEMQYQHMIKMVRHIQKS